VSTRTDASRRAVLAKSELFAALAPEDLDRVLALCRPRKLEAEEILCQAGDPADHVYAILEGRVRVVAQSEDGREVVLRTLGRGEVCGELGVLHAGRRTATMIADTGCELLALPGRQFLALLESRPKAAIALLGALADRIGELTRELSDFVFLSLPSRLAKKLLELAEDHGRSTPEGLRLEGLSQHDLASFVGTSRESVNKQLKLWKAEAIVERGRAAVTLRRPDVLRRIAGHEDEPGAV